MEKHMYQHLSSYGSSNTTGLTSSLRETLPMIQRSNEVTPCTSFIPLTTFLPPQEDTISATASGSPHVPFALEEEHPKGQLKMPYPQGPRNLTDQLPSLAWSITKLPLSPSEWTTTDPTGLATPDRPFCEGLKRKTKPASCGKECNIVSCKKLAVKGKRCEEHNLYRQCKYPGCTSCARSRGYCYGHGGGRRCQVEGCTSGAVSRDLCKRHGGGRRCRVTGCRSSSESRGLCYSHGGGRRCSIPWCDARSRKGGYCVTHMRVFAQRDHNSIFGTSQDTPNYVRKETCSIGMGREKGYMTSVAPRTNPAMSPAIQCDLQKLSLKPFTTDSNRSNDVGKLSIPGSRKDDTSHFAAVNSLLDLSKRSLQTHMESASYATSSHSGYPVAGLLN